MKLVSSKSIPATQEITKDNGWSCRL